MRCTGCDTTLVTWADVLAHIDATGHAVEVETQYLYAVTRAEVEAGLGLSNLKYLREVLDEPEIRTALDGIALTALGRIKARILEDERKD